MQEDSKGGTVAVSPGSGDAEEFMRKVHPYFSFFVHHSRAQS